MIRGPLWQIPTLLLLAAPGVHGAPQSAPVGAPAEGATAQRFVLAAGANDGGPGRVQLRYAVSDAQNFAEVMVAMGGVAPANRLLLQDPDRRAFEAGVQDLARRVAEARAARAHTEAMLYFSGHADEDGLLLGQERLGYRDLRQLLETVQADVRIAVLDACASGAITRIKGGQQRAAFLLDAAADTRGYAFLTSSSAQESAQESDRIGASYFTYYLVSGMRGAADVSADGRVTLGEAYQFAADETLARTVELQGGAQHPAYDMNLSGTGDVVMTDVRRVSAGVQLAEDVEGRLFVRGADRRLVAELYKPAGRAVELGLEPDEYDIFLERRRQLHVARRGLVDGERTQLALADFAPAPREEAVSRGGPLWSGAQPPQPARPEGRLRAELHFGGIGPEPRATPQPAQEAAVLGEDRFGVPVGVPAAVSQIQPWGALSGLAIGYGLTPHWEATLSWATLGSDVDERMVSSDGARTLRKVRLTSVLLGARWYPLAPRRLRPFAALAIGTFEGSEEGVTLDGARDWSTSRNAIGGQVGAGLDLDLTRNATFGLRAAYNWMSAFGEPVGGRDAYRGAELRVAASWRFGG